MRTALQLRGLIANQHERIAWLGVMLEEYPVDCLPRNFHAQCVLARQMLRSFEDELVCLRAAQDKSRPGSSPEQDSNLNHLPAAPAAQSKSALAGPLVTSGVAQPASLSTHV